jgi:ATP-dependent RNA helicase SUPV3L1/SUV3
MDRRPKPAEPAAPEQPAASPADGVAEVDAAAPDGTQAAPPADAPLQDGLAAEPSSEEVAAIMGLTQAPAVSQEPEQSPKPEQSLALQAQAPIEQVPVEEAAAGDMPANMDVAAVPAAPAAPAEPQFIEVWRPGGRADGERPQHRRPRRDHRRHAQPPAEQAAAAPTADAGTPPASSGEARQPRHHRPRHPEHRRERHGKGDRFNKNRGRPERFNEAPREKREREREPDPNSPFAKLAALKAQLEADKDGQR